MMLQFGMALQTVNGQVWHLRICQIALCNPIMLVLVGFVLWASLLYVALEVGPPASRWWNFFAQEDQGTVSCK